MKWMFIALSFAVILSTSVLTNVHAQSPSSFNSYSDWLAEGEKQQQAEDEAEAAKRNIPVDQVISERRAREAAEAARLEEQWAAERRATIIEKIIVIAVLAITAGLVFKFRKRIVNTVSGIWFRQSKKFRLWAFASFFWIIGVPLYLWLGEPDWLYDYGSDRLYALIIVPPLFIGAMWFGYQRFVK